MSVCWQVEVWLEVLEVGVLFAENIKQIKIKHLSTMIPSCVKSTKNNNSTLPVLEFDN